MAVDTSGELGSILGIWAHPDDEAYLSAALMAHAVVAGRRVVCVTATRGEAGFPADDSRSAEERSQLRERELAACLEILGVTEHRWLGYPDGRCADVDDDEAVTMLAAIIDEVRPDTVLTFGPDGGTGHTDHVAACRWTTAAVERANPAPRLLYATKTPRWQDEFFAGVDLSQVFMVDGLEPESTAEHALAVWFRGDDELGRRKVAALLAQSSQVEPFAQAVGLERYAVLVRDEFFREPLPSDKAFIERARGYQMR